jgi:hypothetical protein
MNLELIIDLNTPVWKLTVGELLGIINEQNSKDKQQATDASITDITVSAMPHHVYGLDGLSELFGVSKNTVGRIKKSGVLDDAIVQIGQTIIVDAKKALELAKKAGVPNPKNKKHLRKIIK